VLPGDPEHQEGTGRLLVVPDHQAGQPDDRRRDEDEHGEDGDPGPDRTRPADGVLEEVHGVGQQNPLVAASCPSCVVGVSSFGS
jgi:hypothetical protein